MMTDPDERCNGVTENRRDDAYRRYVTDHRPALVRAARLLSCGDAHLAEDLVQEALTRVYVAWPRLRPGGVHAYTHRVLVNAFIDVTRRPGRRHEQTRGELPEVVATDPPLAEDGEAVRNALATLPPRMRSAVVLRHWLQLDVAETARVLGCSQGTVKSQTARGLDRLRESLRTVPRYDPAGASARHHEEPHHG